MAKFDELLDKLRGELKSLAEDHFGDYTEDAIQDGERMVAEIQGDLKKWTEQLESGKLTQLEFQFLIEQKKEVAKMQALKQKGLAKIQIKKFQHELINTVTGLVEKYY